MSKSWVWRLCVALAVLAGIVGGASAFGDPHDDQGGVTVRIGWVPATSWTPWATLTEKLKGTGVNAELVPFKSSNDSLTALVKGEIQMTPVGYNNVASLLADSTPGVRYVSGISENGSVFVARKGSGIRTWNDLRGKRIATLRGSTQYANLASAMGNHGVDLDRDATFVNMQSFSDLNFALQRGDVDAICTFPPLSGQAVEAGGTEVPEIQAGLYDGSFTVSSGIVANDEFLRRHRDQARILLTAYVKQFRELSADPEKWAEKFAGLSAGTDEKALVYALKKRYIKPSLNLDERQIRTVPRVLHRLGVIKEDTGPALTARVDYSLLQQVTGESARELGQEG